MSFVIIFSTFPKEEDAAESARILVEEKLVACVSLIPAIRSIYRWKGAVEDENEVLAIMKTTDKTVRKLQARLLELHPYEVPEIVAIPLVAGHGKYLKWIEECVK